MCHINAFMTHDMLFLVVVTLKHDLNVMRIPAGIYEDNTQYVFVKLSNDRTTSGCWCTSDSTMGAEHYRLVALSCSVE